MKPDRGHMSLLLLYNHIVSLATVIVYRDLLAKDADQATKDAEKANSSANSSPKRSIPFSKFREYALF